MSAVAGRSLSSVAASRGIISPTMSDVQIVCIGSFGALLQELSNWHSAKTKLSNKTYQKLMNSPAYWVVVGLNALASGLGTWLWFYDGGQRPATYLVFGAAFPLILKKAVSAYQERPITFGTVDSLARENESVVGERSEVGRLLKSYIDVA